MKKEISKGQAVRLVDVFALGPFMVYAGYRKSNLPVPMRAGLVASGIATIILNAINYHINLKKGA
jgi:hypothetical protein